MATEIPLTRGEVAVVDDEDAVWLRRWSWCASPCHGGRMVAVRGVKHADGSHETVYMHRTIMGLCRGDGREVDHVNFDPLDNRRSNLKVVTPLVNKRRAPGRGGSSRFVGVTWDKTRQLWRAQVQVDGRVTNLGRYRSEREAAEARDAYVRLRATGHHVNFAA